MKRIKALLSILIIGSLVSPAVAASIIPCGTGAPALMITKFSFNSTADFVDLTVVDDTNNGAGATLNNWKLGTIDATLKTFTNFPIRTGENYSFKDIPGLTATTDQIVLVDDQGVIKDAVCWTSSSPTTQEQSDFAKLGTEWSSAISSCIPSDGLPKDTIFTRSGSQDTNTASDWQKVSSAVTPDPTQTPQTQTPTTTPNAPIATNEVIVNELLPDPEGSDEGGEWIELRNTSDHTVSLAGWQLDDEEGGSKPYAFKNETIGAESFLVMNNSVTHITLNNTKDSARLIDPNGIVTSSYTYPKVTTGKSWARMKSGTWTIAESPTPQDDNEPKIVEPDAADMEDATNTPAEESADQNPETPGPVDISEVFPNPTGTDQGGEWIEIHNVTNSGLDLSGWKIKNAAGKTFTLPDGTAIPPLGYLILTDTTTKITLKNSGDQIQILDPDNTLQDKIEFETAPENTSFAKIETVGVEEVVPSTTISWMEWLVPSAKAATQEATKSTSEAKTDSWEWTEMVTKGAPNPIYYRITGVVTRELDESNTFEIEKNGKIFTIHLDPKKIHPDVVKASLKKAANIEITALEKEHKLILESYGAASGSEEQSSSAGTLPAILISATIIALGGATYLGVRYREKITALYDAVTASSPDDTPSHRSQSVPPTP